MMKTTNHMFRPPRVAALAAIGLAALLTSCSIFRPEEDAEEEKKGRFDFLRSEQKERVPAEPETIEQEQVLPDKSVASESDVELLEQLNSSGKPGET